MPLVTFLILHYMTMDVTVNCINSILNKTTYLNYKIIVVDNGSINNTGSKIASLYKDNAKIKVICLEDNLGFSAGNNVGYAYAKQILHSDYIIMINNDTEMIQKDFIQRAIECYESTFYFVLGPDIVNLNGNHQNPRRDHVITKSEAKIILIEQYLEKIYLHIHKHLRLPDEIFKIKKIKDSFTKKSIIISELVTLQGACLVFSPLFINNNTLALEEVTFMYGEEDLLAIRCKSNNWKTVYNPELKILHAEQVATKMTHKKLVGRKIFNNDNSIKALKKVLEKL